MLREGKKFWKLSMQLACIAVVALLVWGCGGGGSSYDTPTATQTPTPLIDAATLKGWMDSGLVNSDDFENVVILQVGAEADYDAGHIPGAHYWGTITQAGRLEGLAYDVKVMVPNGQTVDAMIQRTGINEDTTIVISYATTTNIYYPARTYFTLRYWGFPKERIKVLNGGNNGWLDATYALTTDETPERVSSYSVVDNGELCDDLRYSIGEMIQAVDENNASIADTGMPAYNIIQQTTDVRVIANAIGRSYAWFAENGTTTGGYFISAAEAAAVLLDNNGPLDDLTLGDFDEDLPSITHCVSGMSCTPIFFAADALLGLDIAVYDGSKSQWDLYRGDEAGDDPLINNAWNVNYNGRSTDTTIVSATLADDINPTLNFLFQSNDDPDANQIEQEDAEYMYPASGGTSSGAPSAGSGDASGC